MDHRRGRDVPRPEEVVLLSDSKTPDRTPALLSEDAAASECGVSSPTFRRWAAASCIAPVLMPGAGRRRFYRREDIEIFTRSGPAR
jgi:hypothetical protein